MLHLLQFFFAPPNQPWYAGAVWGNVVAIVPCGLLGWLWSKTKFWPLNLLNRKVSEMHHHHTEIAERHERILDALDPNTEGGLKEVIDRIDNLKQ